MFANCHRPVEPARSELTKSIEDCKCELTELFADDLPPIREIIAGSDTVGAHTVHDIPTSPVWHKCPVLLIGDVAHATSPSAGQGASMACEDAIVLAKCLQDNETPQTAFTEFEALRQERVERVVAYSWMYGYHIDWDSTRNAANSATRAGS